MAINVLPLLLERRGIHINFLSTYIAYLQIVFIPSAPICSTPEEMMMNKCVPGNKIK